jgi:hypothetical protein
MQAKVFGNADERRYHANERRQSLEGDAMSRIFGQGMASHRNPDFTDLMDYRRSSA